MAQLFIFEGRLGMEECTTILGGVKKDRKVIQRLNRLPDEPMLPFPQIFSLQQKYTHHVLNLHDV